MTTDTISTIVDGLKRFVGKWDTPVYFTAHGRILRVERLENQGDQIMVHLSDKKFGLPPKPRKKHPETQTTSEFAMQHFNWQSSMPTGSMDAVDTLRNQLQTFFNEELLEPLALPLPDGYTSIEEWIDTMTVKDIKEVLGDIEAEIVRLTAVRDMVIATKKEIKKEMNS